MKRWSAPFVGLGMLCWCASCDDITPLSIEIVLPTEGSSPQFSTLVFGASDGTTTVQQSFSADEKELKLPVIPYGDGWVLSLEGRAGETPISFGKTVPLSLRSGEETNAKLFFSQINAFHVPPDQPQSNPQPLSLEGLPPLSVGSCALPGGGFGFMGGTQPEYFSPSELSFSPISTDAPLVGTVCAASPNGALLIGGSVDAQGSQLCGGVESLEQARVTSGLTSQELARIAHQVTAFSPPQNLTLPDGTLVEAGATLLFISGGVNDTEVTGQVGLIISAPNQEPRLYEPTDPSKKLIISPRAGHSATLVQFNGKDKLLVAGGVGPTGEALDTTELLDLSTFIVESGPPLSQARAGLSAVLIPDGDVLFIGGQDQQQQSSPRIERFSPRFSEIVAEPDMIFARRGHSATLLENGLILIAGGIGQRAGSPDGDQRLTSGELFDPEDASQSGTIFTRPLNAPRVGHAAVLLPNGLVLLMGGTQTDAPSAEFYTPVPEN